MTADKEKSKLLKNRLRDKYRKEGLETFSEAERIRLLLTYSSPADFEKKSQRLYENYGSLSSAIDADTGSLEKICGLDERAIALLKIIPQLSRIYFMNEGKIAVLNSAKTAIKYFERYFIGALEEQLAIVCTDEKLRLISVKTISKGNSVSLKSSFRSIADFALNQGAACIFAAHNHPMGSAAYSVSDRLATDFLCENLEKLGITLIDHIIADKNSAVSLREQPNPGRLGDSESFGYIYRNNYNMSHF